MEVCFQTALGEGGGKGVMECLCRLNRKHPESGGIRMSGVCIRVWRVRVWRGLQAEYDQAVLQGGEGFFTGRGGDAAEYHLCAQRPSAWDVPGLGDGRVDNRVVMLQVGADACCGQGRPDSVLVHGVGVLGPNWEVGGVSRHFFLQALDDGLVFKE